MTRIVDGRFIFIVVMLMLVIQPVFAAETWNVMTTWGSAGSSNGQFISAGGIAVDSSGIVYVADTGNNRTQKFDSGGVFISTLGSGGTGDGQFSYPEAVVVDSSGNTFVLDTGNNRIQKFNSAGTFLLQWGTFGSAEGQFDHPKAIALDSAGNVFVADTGNNRVQVFGPAGTLLTSWNLGYAPYGIVVDATNVFVTDRNNNKIQKYNLAGSFLSEWGSVGSGNGQFNNPLGIALDSAHYVYVTDSGNNRVQKFSSDGSFIATWGSSGSNGGQFSSPTGICVDSIVNVYVADSGNSRVQKFSRSYPPPPTIKSLTPNWAVQDTLVNVTHLDGSGFLDGLTVKLQSAGHTDIIATNVTVLSPARLTCTLYIRSSTATGPWNLVVINPDGQTATLTNGFEVRIPGTLPETFIYSMEWGAQGSGNGQFNNPVAVAADSSGNVYVVDKTNHRIQKFNVTGGFLSRWGKNSGDGSSGSGNGEFLNPEGIAIDNLNNIYVTDTGNNRIQKFSSGGSFIAAWGSYGSGDTQFNNPTSIVVDKDGFLYITDKNRLVKYTSNGGFISTFLLGDVSSSCLASFDTNIYLGLGVLAQYNRAGAYIKNINNPAPSRIATDSSGSQYWLWSGHLVQKIDSQHRSVAQWGTSGAGDAQFSSASGVGVSPNGTVYIADTGNNRIQVFTQVTPPPPYIDAITPNYGTQGSLVNITYIDGRQFQPGAAVRFQISGHTDLVATNVTVLSSTRISCTLPIGSSSATGVWTVRVINPDGQSGALADGFTVNTPSTQLPERYQYLYQWGSQGSDAGQFNSPKGITTDSSGNIYVVDTVNNRVQKFNRSGGFLMAWGRNGGDGSSGTGDGEFLNPVGITVDPLGYVYVVDTGNNRIQKFTSNGTFVTKWGAFGTWDDQFNAPTQIAADSDGFLYILDFGNNRIIKCDSDGGVITKWDVSFYCYPVGNLPSSLASYGTNIYVVTPSGSVWGCEGSGCTMREGYDMRVNKYNPAGSFIEFAYSKTIPPATEDRIAYDSSGNIYILSKGWNSIKKIDPYRRDVSQWGTAGAGDSQFNLANAITLSSDGIVYVADTNNNRIQAFARVTPPPPTVNSINPNHASKGKTVSVTKLSGADFVNGTTVRLRMSGQTDIVASDVTVLSQDTISCKLTLDNTITPGSWDVAVTNPDGQTGILTSIFTIKEPISPFPENYVYVSEFGTMGSKDGRFNLPMGIAVNSAGEIYVVDQGNNRVQKFDASGNFLLKWGRNGGDGSEGTGDGQFKKPSGIALDSAGNVYVTDTGNYRVQKFDPNGTYLNRWGAQGTDDDQFSYPYGIAIDQFDNVYVTDATNAAHRMVKFTSNGTFVTKWDTAIPREDGWGLNPFGVATYGDSLFILGQKVDSPVNVWNSDIGRIQQYNNSGYYINQFNINGKDSFGITSDLSGNIYFVAYAQQSKTSSILKYTSAGVFVTQWGSEGFGDGQFKGPQGVAVAPGSSIYVVDRNNNRIQKFALSIPPNTTPIVYFRANVVSGVAPLTVRFTDLSVGAPANWTWNFGDGNTSAFQNPVYAYNMPGVYSVTLTVGNVNGVNTTAKVDYITITAPPSVPVANFTADPTSGLAPLTVQFTDTSLNEPTAWNWSFGDGTYTVSQNPSHQYSIPSVYSVQLRVSNGAGSDSMVRTNYITVNGTPIQPVANFTADRTSGNASLTVQFMDLSTGYPNTWSWNFGDMGAGNTSTERNPVHVYTDPGFFTVRLSVQNPAGSDTKTRIGYINVTGNVSSSYYDLYLSPGWNFVSTPKRLSAGNNTAMIFASVDTAGHSLFTYNASAGAWHVMTAGDLVNPLDGIWIYAVHDSVVRIRFDQTPIVSPPSKTLASGWNAIGYSYLEPAAARDALNSVRTKWSTVIGFNPATQMYETSIINGGGYPFSDTRFMIPGRGYWVFMIEPGELGSIS